MVVELTDPAKAAGLFDGWQETLIFSCLQGIMGKIYVTDPERPLSAMAYVGCFAFYAGVPDRELAEKKPAGFVIMTPRNEAWAACIRECFEDKGNMYRIGGDEFVALVHADEKELERRLKRYEACMRTWSEDNALPLSAACGCVCTSTPRTSGRYCDA